MSLITLPAFLTRRREDTPMPETAVAETPLMRFLTQGGAEVHVARVGTYTTQAYSGRVYDERDDRWSCLGCGKGSGQHDRYSPSEIRDAANEHAANCRAMPKPEA